MVTKKEILDKYIDKNSEIYASDKDETEKRLAKVFEKFDLNALELTQFSEDKWKREWI